MAYLVNFDSLNPKIPLSSSKDVILGSLPSLEVRLIFTVLVVFHNNGKRKKIQNLKLVKKQHIAMQWKSGKQAENLILSEAGRDP